MRYLQCSVECSLFSELLGNWRNTNAKGIGKNQIFRLHLTMQQIPGYLTLRQVIRPGTGKEVGIGSKVSVHAKGSVKETGYTFWSTKDPGQKPFEFPAGLGRVITGWDQGVIGMKIGEARRLEIPAVEGYGPGGFPAWKIPPNATLIFEIEVLSIA
jgi:peptidylprolyl isomerase